jgi:acetyl-CoA carboxylase carboxyltransferase component/biotin carboxyl carrier protein
VDDPTPDDTAPDDTAPDDTAPDDSAPDDTAPDDTAAATFRLAAPVTGACVSVHVDAGAVVAAGTVLVVLESMKTEHEVTAPTDLEVLEVAVALGDEVAAGAGLVTARPATVDPTDPPEVRPARDEPRGVDRPDLAEVLHRRWLLTDDARPAAVARRSERGRRTARHNVEALVDPGSFSEYGGLALAAQRSRRGVEDLLARTPADGLLCGTATVAGTSVALLAYDASVLAGTQGFVNHRKTDRLLDLAERHRLSVVLLAEGGGGRPGDVDAPGASSLDVRTFARFARLAGRVPTVAVVAGYCFAGNAALAGCCDVVVATEDSNLGMAGPAMIEGGGLGVVAPTDIGPVAVQWANGVVDRRVADEATAVAEARRLVALATHRPSPGPTGVVEGRAVADQSVLRDAVPLGRRRPPDVRAVLRTLADDGEVVELRGGYAPGMVTALLRLGGRPVGVLANDAHHLGGAIDVDGARSAQRLVELCDRWDLPVLALCDTPGFMVGPEAEAAGQVRVFGDLFVAAARVRVPWLFVAVRKAYGLGAQAMAGGSFHEPLLTLSWPTGEFGGMGLEGAVRLGFRDELAAIADPAERARTEADLIERAYAHGGALNVASHFEIDDVVDPADTRDRLLAALVAAGR